MSDYTIWPATANRWAVCAGSIQAEARYPDIRTDASDEGDIAHELAKLWIPLIARGASGEIPDDPRFTPEIIDGVSEYVAAVQDAMREIGCFTPQVEEFIAIPRIHQCNGGRLDCSLWSPGSGVLWIFDFKFGHRVVEHIGDFQLVEYAIGKLDQLSAGNGMMDEVVTVKMTIAQPRAYHPEGPVRTWTVRGSDLRSYANTLRFQAEQSQDPNPPTVAGPHCLNCRAARDCRTLQMAAAGVVDRIERLELNNLSPDHRGYELSYLDRATDILKARKDALEAEALAQAQMGTPTPGWGIGTGRGSKIWTASVDEVAAMGDLLEIDLRKPMEVITPTQAINVKKVDADVINAYSKTTPGKARLIRSNETISARLFSANTK